MGMNVQDTFHNPWDVCVVKVASYDDYHRQKEYKVEPGCLARFPGPPSIGREIMTLRVGNWYEKEFYGGYVCFPPKDRVTLVTQFDIIVTPPSQDCTLRDEDVIAPAFLSQQKIDELSCGGVNVVVCLVDMWSQLVRICSRHRISKTTFLPEGGPDKTPLWSLSRQSLRMRRS